MFVMAKKIRELFASTLNGITARVRCVSSMAIVLKAKFTRLLAAHANKQAVRNEKARQECHAVLIKTLTFNFYRSLHYARKTSLFYTFQRSMQANRNINLW